MARYSLKDIPIDGVAVTGIAPKVLIYKDCRPGGTATGQYAYCEGSQKWTLWDEWIRIPYFRLPGGEIIWGHQCWWTLADGTEGTVEEEQAALEERLAEMRGMFQP